MLSVKKSKLVRRRIQNTDYRRNKNYLLITERKYKRESRGTLADPLFKEIVSVPLKVIKGNIEKGTTKYFHSWTELLNNKIREFVLNYQNKSQVQFLNMRKGRFFLTDCRNKCKFDTNRKIFYVERGLICMSYIYKSEFSGWSRSFSDKQVSYQPLS